MVPFFAVDSIITGIYIFMYKGTYRDVVYSWKRYSTDERYNQGEQLVESIVKNHYIHEEYSGASHYSEYGKEI